MQKNAKKVNKTKDKYINNIYKFSCAKQSILWVRLFNDIALKFEEIFFFLRKTALLSKMHHQLSLPSLTAKIWKTILYIDRLGSTVIQLHFELPSFVAIRAHQSIYY